MAGRRSPRVLKLSFELHVPEGLETQIRFSSVEAAADGVISAVVERAADVFPWADQISVRKEWVYQWWDKPEEIKLPATEKNTVVNEVTS